MKYLFVTLSILALWIAIIAITIYMNYQELFLPIASLVTTIILFEIGFGERK